MILGVGDETLDRSSKLSDRSCKVGKVDGRSRVVVGGLLGIEIVADTRSEYQTRREL